MVHSTPLIIQYGSINLLNVIPCTRIIMFGILANQTLMVVEICHPVTGRALSVLVRGNGMKNDKSIIITHLYLVR